MIVCVCRAVSDRQIRALIEDGASSMAEIRGELGTGECCGKCSRQVREMIDQFASCCGGRESAQQCAFA